MADAVISFTDSQACWQQALRDAYREPLALLRDLDIDPASIDWLDDQAFQMKVPRSYAARMQRGNPHDPLLLQVLPRRMELDEVPGFVQQPLQETAFQPSPGLIQKYHGRALLLTTPSCGVHCRYCFRRHFDYRESGANLEGWEAALETLANDPSISEVILSGGDPLSLSDDKLNRLIRRIENIPHVQRLRLHSRQPVVLPERITTTLVQNLQQSRLRVVMVLHANHAQELDHSVLMACQAMQSAGIMLLNQAVLLNKVNDTVAAQEQLALRLFECGVLPYYLHQLDAVAGAAHFALAEDQAHGIMRGLNARLPGYLVPRLVQEIPGMPGKMPVAWAK